MTLQELFTPRLSKKRKKSYSKKELAKRIRKLEEMGYTGAELGLKVSQAQQVLKQETKNGIFHLYFKPTRRHKQVFQNHILDHNLLPLFETSDTTTYQLPSSIKTDKQFTDHIVKLNLFSTVFPAFKRFDEAIWQPCIFTKDHVGWITKDKDGYYRYCSRNVKTGVIIGFSLLDLMEIVFAKDYIGTDMGYIISRKKAASVLNVRYRDLDYDKQQQEKYNSNLAVISNLKEWKTNYPNLFSFTKSQLYILEELHQFASQHIMEKRHSINKEAVFFVSIRQMAQLMKDKLKIERNPSTYAVAINLFATLGILNKVPSETLTHKEELLKIARNIQRNQIHYHFINIMTIPHYNEELLLKAEKMAKRLKKHKITTAKQITFENLSKVMSEKKAREIINVREVSLMNMPPDKLQKVAEEALGEFPWEAIDMICMSDPATF
ncbi:hypothetical protein [Schinkia azotoformans]|uniref:hypothetical protein n=1 Tax=Schinkia azotoformans TaxID=1454 RepID=UPI002DC018F7|nr:hypothetical protein [Schinkia azotoformans]MEC1759874.1 hypothetical protein [Schinkia azotoformans]